MAFIKNRFPKRSEFLAVLGIAVFVCHGWSLRGFFNELPSFMLYFRFGEILTILAYMMAFALVESLIVAGGISLLAAILPSSWLRDGFSYKGLIIVVVGAIAAIRFQKSLQNVLPPMQALTLDLVLPLVAIAILIFLAHLLKPVQKLLLDVSDRFLIMLYVFLPIGVLSFFVVVFRNLV